MQTDIDLSSILLEQKPRIVAAAERKGVLGDIHEKDMLFDFLVRAVFPLAPGDAIDAYFDGGEDCCRRFAMLCTEHIQRDDISVLEFAAGYGRVARHVRHAMPKANWTCCDIHPEAVDYARSKLGLEASLSSSVPEEWGVGGRSFDVVFALSFFSHMPHATFSRWLERLMDAVSSGGLLIFTTHGEVSAANMRAGGLDVDLEKMGFAWNPASDQRDIKNTDYGTSVVTLSYVHDALKNIPTASLVRYQQAWWWGHQDLYAVRRI
jgi:SAM-dependent methyltransferase